MKKALIITVGVGETVHNSIYATLSNRNPNLAVYVVSKESKQTLERPLNQMNEKCLRNACDKSEIVELQTAEDINYVFQQCDNIYHDLLRKTYSTSEIEVDYTSGTKVMTAAISALAILYGLGMNYVSGMRDERGIVKTGTEKLESVRPLSAMRRLQLEKLKEYFCQYQFSACLKIANEEYEQIELYEENSKKRKISDLIGFLEGFASWERFEHKEAYKKFKNVGTAVIQQKYLCELLSDYKYMANKHHGTKGNIPSRYVIVDLLQNAVRRAKEHNFDDAVARLYRCIEMTIQYSLAEAQEIYTTALEVAALREKISSETFERLSKKSKGGKIDLGLVDGFSVLKESSPGHPLSRAYDSLCPELKVCLELRNLSILAHGTKPVQIEQYERMEKLAKEFVKLAVVAPCLIETPKQTGDSPLAKRDDEMLLEQKSNEIERCFSADNLDDFIY
jgi:CRISPR-associated protein (TIGR02710 family)